jgi:hypothetical protein
MSRQRNLTESPPESGRSRRLARKLLKRIRLNEHFIRVAHHGAIDKLFELTQNPGVPCPHGGRTSCPCELFYLGFGGLERQRHSLPIVL